MGPRLAIFGISTTLNSPLSRLPLSYYTASPLPSIPVHLFRAETPLPFSLAGAMDVALSVEDAVWTSPFPMIAAGGHTTLTYAFRAAASRSLRHWILRPCLLQCACLLAALPPPRCTPPTLTHRALTALRACFAPTAPLLMSGFNTLLAPPQHSPRHILRRRHHISARQRLLPPPLPLLSPSPRAYTPRMPGPTGYTPVLPAARGAHPTTSTAIFARACRYYTSNTCTAPATASSYATHLLHLPYHVDGRTAERTRWRRRGMYAIAISRLRRRQHIYAGSFVNKQFSVARRRIVTLLRA